MSGYEYTNPFGVQLTINSELDGSVYMALGTAVIRPHVQLPADERVKAAQALVGDHYGVIPVDEHAATNQLIDSADVRVGDVVEVEADDGSWMVRGKVTEIVERGEHCYFDMTVSRDTKVIGTHGATVRLVPQPKATCPECGQPWSDPS